MIKVDENLELKPISLISAQLIFESINSSRAHLRKWLPFVETTKSVVDTRNFIKSVLHNQCIKPEEVIEVWHQTNFAGLISFKEIDHQNHKGELGYWLDRSMTKKGIMIKSVKALISYGFNKLKLNRITIKVATGNERSIAIPKKLGFTFEGFEREGEFIHGHYHNLEVYSLLKNDWK